MRKKKRFTKFFIEKLAYGEALSLMNRVFSAGLGYTFQIEFRFLTVEIGISEESKLAF
ncbi:MAG: hypothetical protein WBO35_02945 [Candidatus Saccharimonadales bacterium]